jgi:DNA-binding HxlR family transcriptional regulator
MRKLTSTNAVNEASLIRNCGVVYALNLIGGRWKPTILFSLLDGQKRYTQLLKNIPGISERMLAAQLRELEKDALVKRTVYAEVPQRVEYELTALGMTAAPLLQHMSDWGNTLREGTPVQSPSGNSNKPPH